MPVLTHNWFHFDLFYLIEKNQITTNLQNFSLFSKIPEYLKQIELTDFGIESIDSNAFKNFPNLKILKLSQNSLSSIDLGSFSLGDQSDFSSESSSLEDNLKNSNLIELDLSFNKILNLKFENFLISKVLGF